MSHYFVLGLGISGKAAVSKLLKEGYEVRAWDDSLSVSPLSEDVKKLCKSGLRLDQNGGKEAIECVLSPGIPFSHPLLQDLCCPIVGEAEFALRLLPNPCVGVTGTNGKTTVAMLAAHLLNGAGIAARAVGNNGVPLSDLEVPKDEVLVVELSSYQIDAMSSKSLDLGVLLNITADHLDRYRTLEAYAASKARIADCLKEGGEFWVEEETAKQYASHLQGKELRTFGLGKRGTLRLETVEYILPLSYRTKSKYDLLNVAAALALCRPFCTCNSEILQALESFEKPEHRIEYVIDIDGVSYFNDSKGTNVAAVMHAVQSMPAQVVLIAGGVEKGGSYRPWRKLFADKVHSMCLIGEAASQIAEDLEGITVIHRCVSLEEAVHRAHSCAEAGDSVLLSPGCSSFDMFRNYAHRGSEFKRFVRELEGVRKG